MGYEYCGVDVARRTIFETVWSSPNSSYRWQVDSDSLLDDQRGYAKFMYTLAVF